MLAARERLLPSCFKICDALERPTQLPHPGRKSRSIAMAEEASKRSAANPPVRKHGRSKARLWGNLVAAHSASAPRTEMESKGLHHSRTARRRAATTKQASAPARKLHVDGSGIAEVVPGATSKYVVPPRIGS